MADSAAFEAACVTLEESASLDRLVARGTIRLVLKAAGLEPRSVTARELVVAVKRLLPAELAARGVAEGERLCASIVKALDAVAENRTAQDSPDAVFARLGTS
jgi:hypothetical protein